LDLLFEGSAQETIDATRTAAFVDRLLERLGALRKVLLIPPDFTRFHSGAGEITALLYNRLKDRARVEILPATGTHFPMEASEIARMFPGIPPSLFRKHDWRKDVISLGEVPGAFIREVSEGKLDTPIACEVNRALVEEDWDAILSIGQLVPHEVAGIANHNKNIFVGAGGKDTIGKTHFLGAVCGMERAMGRARTPVRDVLNYMSAHFAKDLPIVYLLTVRQREATGQIVTRGLFAGRDEEPFILGARLCQQVNLDLLDQPLRKAVVYLDPKEFKSTWLGNKAIYRTRMALAAGGELIVLAPGVRQFGEDPENDRLIRAYGYCGTDAVLRHVRQSAELAENLSVAAHLIHGSSEGRFQVTYCTGRNGLTREEVEKAGFRHRPLDEALREFHPEALRDGFNRSAAGEEYFLISNPALGLWALKNLFTTSSPS
jgi:nickel-dependent lactate racemase